MPGSAGGCWGSPPHHLAVPQRAVKVRGKDGPPGCCLSTFPARPSVRNGEALSGIRRWLRVIVTLPPQPQHPNTVHGVQAQLAALERQQSDPSHGGNSSHEAVPRAPREGPSARPCLGAPYLGGSLMTATKPSAINRVGTCRAGCGPSPRGSHPTGLWFLGFTCTPSSGMVATGDIGWAAQAGTCPAALLAPSRCLTSTWQLWSRPHQCLPRACSD